MNYTGMSPYRFSIFEQDKGWYSLYTIFCSQVFMLVNVYLDNTGLITYN